MVTHHVLCRWYAPAIDSKVNYQPSQNSIFDINPDYPEDQYRQIFTQGDSYVKYKIWVVCAFRF